MALRDALAPVIRLILLIAYGCYVGLGLILCALGIYYTTSVQGANGFVTMVAIAGGFFMMVVGGIGIFANLKSNALLCAVALLVDVAIFVFLLAACIVGIFVANEVKDPVSRAVQEAYCDNPATTVHSMCTRDDWTPDNPGVTFRVSNWQKGVLETMDSGAPHSCKVFNDRVIEFASAVNLAEEACTFTPCQPAGADDNGCVAAAFTTAERCACKAAIAAVEPLDAIATTTCDLTTYSSEEDAAETTVCSEIVAGAPVDCVASLAPVDDSDVPRWSASPGLVTGSCETDTGCAVSEGHVTPTLCDEMPSGCNKTAGSGTCELISAREAVARVLPRAAVTEICPTGCVHTPEVLAVEEVVEACVPTRGFLAETCTSTASNTGTNCPGIDDPADCDATRNADPLDDDCVWANELVCTLDSAGATAAERCTASNNGEENQWTPGTGDCHYIPAIAAVEAADGTCVSGGDVGAATYEGAKAMAVTPDDCAADTCKTKGQFMGNCTMVGEYFDAAMEIRCNECWDHWQYKVVDEVKGNLWPATFTVFALFLFMVILVCINYYLIDNSDDEGSFSPSGIFKILAFVFNGVVMFFGLIVVIIGVYVLLDLTDEANCPAGQDCTNSAVVGLIVVGIFILLCAIVSLVAVILGSIIGLMLLRISNLVFLVLALLLLIVGIGFAIIAGAMDSVNKQYEDQFDDVRRQYESEDPTVCAGMDDEKCKQKIMSMAASNNVVIAVVLGIICFSFLFIMFLTLEAFYIYKGGDGDDGDDDGDDD